MMTVKSRRACQRQNLLLGQDIECFMEWRCNIRCSQLVETVTSTQRWDSSSLIRKDLHLQEDNPAMDELMQL